MYDRVMQRSLLSVLVAAVLFAGCKSNNNSPTGPSANVPFSATDLRVGTGAEAAVGRSITVAYGGWLYSATAPMNKGSQFDAQTGTSFVLSSGNLIQGWVQGIPGMRVGGQRRLVIPPELAYGASARQGIPANSTLVFDVELLAVQ